MPLHSAMVGTELHQDRLISVATTADAGKVTTPSALTDGEGELRKLLATELDTELLVADASKALFQSNLNDGEPVWRVPQAADVDGFTVAQRFEFADIGTIDAQYGVLPYAATSVRFGVVLYGAITGADETVTVTIGSAAGVALTVPVAGSGAGVVTLKALTTLSVAQAAGVAITVATAGTSTGPIKAAVTVWTES